MPEVDDVTPIKVTFKLSWLSKGAWVKPHTDIPAKIVSILLYFAEPDWRESYGGGTEIYVPKFSLLRKNWHNIDAPFDLMNRWQTFAFIPNRLVFFVKSKNSWHGVSRLTCPEGRSRKSLMVTIQHLEQMEGPLQQRFYKILKSIALGVIRARMRFS